MTRIARAALSLIASMALLTPSGAIAELAQQNSDKSGGQTVRIVESPKKAAAYPMEESLECVMSVVPFYIIAQRDNDPDIDMLKDAGLFWVDQLELTGEPPAGLENDVRDRIESMENKAAAATTPEQTAAFLAPHQATFDACEEKRKDLAAE